MRTHFRSLISLAACAALALVSARARPAIVPLTAMGGPPQVRLEAPSSAVAGTSFTLEGRVIGSTNITAVQVYIDGQFLVSRSASSTDVHIGRLGITIPVRAGGHTIRVQASDTAGRLGTDVIQYVGSAAGGPIGTGSGSGGTPPPRPPVTGGGGGGGTRPPPPGPQPGPTAGVAISLVNPGTVKVGTSVCLRGSVFVSPTRPPGGLSAIQLSLYLGPSNMGGASGPILGTTTSLDAFRFCKPIQSVGLYTFRVQINGSAGDVARREVSFYAVR